MMLCAALGARGWRYRVGYLPEHPYLYDYLTPAEYLDYVGRLFGLPRARRPTCPAGTSPNQRVIVVQDCSVARIL